MINKNILVLDIETDNTDSLNPKLVGFAYKINDGHIYYEEAPFERIKKEILKSSNYLKICHNLKFELSYLKSLGIEMSPPYFCTQTACWILSMGVDQIQSDDSTKISYALKPLAEKYLGYKDLKIFKQLSKEYGKPKGFKKDGSPLKSVIPALASEIPLEILSEYCKKDVEMTYKLFQLTYPKLKEQKLWDLFVMEMKLLPIYAQMERNGIKIDKEYLEQYNEQLKQNIEQLEEELSESYEDVPF